MPDDDLLDVNEIRNQVMWKSFQPGRPDTTIELTQQPLNLPTSFSQAQ